MSVPVLVVTPNKGFGGLIQQSLEEAGSYAAVLAASGAEAVALQRSSSPALLVLDADLPDAPLNELIQVMRTQNPEILLVVIPPERGFDPGSLSSLEADRILESPFYLPALLEAVEVVLRESGLENLDRVESPKASLPRLTKMESRPELEPPAWLDEADKAAKHFATLSMQQPAQAALVTREGQAWAHTSALSPAAAEELSRALAEYWDGSGGDLARFVKLEQSGNEHMMYALAFGQPYVLVVLFEASTPFSRLRSIAAGFARSLSQTTNPAASPFMVAEPVGEPPSGHEPPFAFENDETLEEPKPLLDDVPPSVPDDWQPSSPRHPAGDRDSYPGFPPLTETVPHPPQFIELPPEDETGEYLESDPAYQPGRVAASVPDYQTDTIASTPDTLVDYTADTTPSPADKNGRAIKVEPVSPALYHLSYACVLIPRFPTHHLTGPFADHLATWVTQLCLAFGWRLEHLSIRPDYLQWIVNLPPSASPGHLMRIIRQHTSRRLFVQYPHYEQENPSGDFWAPGYFILSSDQPPPADLVQEFIQQTRYRQGISRPR